MVINTDNAILIRTGHDENGDELYLWDSLNEMEPLCKKKTRDYKGS